MKKTLYSKIIDHLLERISDGDFSYDKPIATEKILSEQFDVSIITVRRAIDELTRLGILYKKPGCGCFVKKNRGTSDSSFSAFASQSKLIALVVRLDIPQNGVLEIIRGCNEKLTEENYISNIVDSSIFKHDEAFFGQLAAKESLTGLIHILYDEDFSYANIMDGCNGGLPCVTIDKQVSAHIPSIASNNFVGGLMAANHLIELGHRNIAFYSSSNFGASETVRDRYMGYCKAHVDAGIEINKNFCVFDGQDAYGGVIFENKYKGSKKLKHELDYFGEHVKYLVKNGVTAIQVSNDHVAVRLIKAAIMSGIRVPEDLSVIGFDDSDIGHCCEVPLTTIKQDFFRMGYKAAETLCAIINGKAVKPIENIPVELIKRESADVANYDEQEQIS